MWEGIGSRGRVFHRVEVCGQILRAQHKDQTDEVGAIHRPRNIERLIAADRPIPSEYHVSTNTPDTSSDKSPYKTAAPRAYNLCSKPAINFGYRRSSWIAGADRRR